MENSEHKIAPPPTDIKGVPARAQKINRAAAVLAIVFSGMALLAVLSGYLQPPVPRATDEGSAAHIFQLSIVALFPTLLVFLATADWKKPVRSARPLVFPAVALIVAFTALFYLEHYR